MTPDNPDDVDAPQTGVPQYVVLVPATATQEEWDQLVQEHYALPTPTASEVINLDDDEPIEITHANQTGAVSPPTGTKPLPGNEEFDYTPEQVEAIHQALLKAGLKADVDWSKIRFDISCLVWDVYEGYSHPDQVMYQGSIKRRLQPLKTRLKAAQTALKTGTGRKTAETELKAAQRIYCELSQRYQWHISEQFVPRNYHIFSSNIDELLRCLPTLLHAVQQAQNQPPHEMTANLQHDGTPKNHGIRLIVEELLRIFQRVTGNEPILYASSITHDGSKYQCKGNCHAFLVACVAPTKLVARRYLDSTLLAAHRDWRDEKDPMKASKARPKKKK